jgi:pimeloyl-ACP methyl ester carboxylesterase
MVEFRDSLVAVANHFGPPHAIVGHSLGGAASALAVSEGLPASRLVLVAPSAHPSRFLNLFFDWLDVPHALRDRILLHFEKTLRFAWTDLDVEAYGPRIAVPSLIVHDRGDREVPWQEGAETARLIAGAELMSVESLGHHRLLRDDRVIERIAEFVSA